MLLSNEEKEHFIQWLQQQCASNESLIKQLNTQLWVVVEPLVKKYRVESMACQVVLKMLQSTESQTIGG